MLTRLLLLSFPRLLGDEGGPPFEGAPGEFSIAVDVIGSWFSFVLSVIGRIWRTLVQAIDLLAQAVLTLFSKVGAAFKWIWENIIKGGLTKLANLIIKAHLWLEAHLGPVLRFLNKVRAYIDRIFRLYIRPILQTIQKIRQVLVILRLLHIKFAQTLDAYLARIQSDITRVFLTVRGTLNAIIDVVNVLTGAPTLRRMVAGAVVTRRAIAGVCRIYTGLPIGWFFPNTHATAPPWEQPVTHSSQILDPARNPLAGTLFEPFTPLLPSDFLSNDPTPTDADLATIDPNPYFTLAYNTLVAQEQRWSSFTPGDRLPRMAVENDLGLIAGSGHAWADSTVAMLGV